MAEYPGPSRRSDAYPVDGAGRQSAEFFGEGLRRRSERKEELAKENVLATEAVLAEGTTDENFTEGAGQGDHARREKAAKKAAQSAGAVGSIIFALGFNILLFIVAPLLLTNILFIGLGWAEAPLIRGRAGMLANVLAYVWKIKLDSLSPGLRFNLIDGLIRMVFFVIMIFSMSYLKDIRRIFEYHGAEHKTVFTWEKGLDLTPANAILQRRQHPRCGTSFLMVVMLVAIVLFSVINFDEMCAEPGGPHRADAAGCRTFLRDHPLCREKRIERGLQIYDRSRPLAAKYHHPGTGRGAARSSYRGPQRILKARTAKRSPSLLSPEACFL